MRAETCGCPQPRDRQEIHRLQWKVANWMRFHASIAPARQSHPSNTPLQCLWFPNDSSQIQRTSASSLVPTLLRNKSYRREAIFETDRDSLTNSERNSVGYLKVLLLSRTSRKVREAKNIRITSDTM